MTTVDAGPLPGPMPEAEPEPAAEVEAPALPGPMPEAVVHPGPMPEAEPTPAPVAEPTGPQPADADADVESESRPVGERSSRAARRARRTRMRRTAPAAESWSEEESALAALAAEAEALSEAERVRLLEELSEAERARALEEAGALEEERALAWYRGRARARQEQARARARARARMRRRAESGPADEAAEDEAAEDEGSVDKADAAGSGGRDWWRRRPAPAPVSAPAPARTPPPAPASRVTDSRLRWALRSGSAAATGHLLIWGVTGDPMAGASVLAAGVASLPEAVAAGLSVGGLVAGWRAAALVVARSGLAGIAARITGALAAAAWGRGSAPVVADLLAAGEPWSTLLAPLLAAGPVAAACWLVLDRRAARAQLIPPVRWAAHIPLATTCLSALLYAPGAAL
ncbi:hypothetical protein [Streptomyces sp. Iso 434]|uniref:hypothetical protein n=1 Tax=Streptomyces sp. Iso 434 TaxID=3062272 RepID=UPI00398111E1